MISIKPLFKLSFWFDSTPAALVDSSETILFTFFGLMLIAGAVIHIQSNRKKYDKFVLQIFEKIANLTLTMGFLGMMLFFFAFEQIPMLGARYWFLVWFILAVVWIVYIIHFVRKVLPAEKKRMEMKAEQNRFRKEKKKKKRKR